MSRTKRKRTPKTVLRLPDLEQSKSAVLNSLASQSSRRSYDHAIREFIDWYCSEPRLAFNKTVVTATASLLSRRTTLLRLSTSGSPLLRQGRPEGPKRCFGPRQQSVNPPSLIRAQIRAVGLQQVTPIELFRACPLGLIQAVAEHLRLAVVLHTVIPRDARISLLQPADGLHHFCRLGASAFALGHPFLQLLQVHQQSLLVGFANRPVFFLALTAEAQHVSFLAHLAHLHSNRGFVLKRIGRRSFPLHLGEVLVVLELFHPIAARAVRLGHEVG